MTLVVGDTWWCLKFVTCLPWLSSVLSCTKLEKVHISVLSLFSLFGDIYFFFKPVGLHVFSVQHDHSIPKGISFLYRTIRRQVN